ATLSTGTPDVLLTVFDAPYPEPLHGKRPIGTALGLSLVLSASEGPGRLAMLRVRPSDGAPDRMALAPLAAMGCTPPPARAPPELEQLARQRNASVTLDYLDDLRLAIEVVVA